jgi:gliding motility-associated-like protein
LDDVTCFGANDGAVSVVGIGGSGGYTYSINGGTPQSSGTFTGLAPNTYSILVLDNRGCDTTISITIAEPTQVSVSVSSFEDISCNGLCDGMIIVLGNGGTPSYTFSIDGINFQSVDSFDALCVGNYTIEIADANNCRSTLTQTLIQPAVLSASTQITEITCFDLSDGTATSIVNGGVTPYTVSATSNGSTYTSTTNTISNLPGGNYTLTVIDANGCITTDNFVIQPAPPRPSLEITPDTSVVKFGQTVTLNAVYGSNVLNPTFVWTPSAGLSCTTCQSTEAQPGETTVYTVDMYVNPLNPNCYISATGIVVVTSDIVMPTAFSPNGDGKNDTYYPVFFGFNPGVDMVDFRVFNRWGEVIHNDPKNGWDGNYKGSPQGVETYVYFLRALVADPYNPGQRKEIVKEGSFTLLR